MIRTVPVMRGAQGVNYMKTCLSIAGSDCSGGAGIQADLKTFSALDTFGMSVIVSVVAENTATVKSIHEVPCEIIADQIDCVFTDIPPDAVKIGMLPTSEIMRTVAAGLRAYRATPLVVDPVMVAKNGAALMYEEARATLLTEILPLATVLTPNLPEAEVILGRSIATLEEMRAAAADIAALGPASSHGGGRASARCALLGWALPRFFRAAHRYAEHAWHRLHALVGHRRVSGAGMRCGRSGRTLKILYPRCHRTRAPARPRQRSDRSFLVPAHGHGQRVKPPTR